MSQESGGFQLYGLLAEFKTPEELVEGCRKVREAGYTKLDAFSPFPVEGVYRALKMPKLRLPMIVLFAGILGGCFAFFMQYYLMAVNWPLNVAGRPPDSWPHFIPVTFELTVLVASLTSAITMLGMNGLPMPYHPLFNVHRFRLASQSAFFLCVQSTDAQFDADATRSCLLDAGAKEVFPVDE